MNVVQIGTEPRHTYCFPFIGIEKAVVMFTVKMIMIDECGDEVVVDTFNINDDLDEDYVEVWESMKIEKTRQRYPEAQRFYFENSRDIQRRVNAELNGYREEDDDDINEWGEIEI